MSGIKCCTCQQYTLERSALAHCRRIVVTTGVTMVISVLGVVVEIALSYSTYGSDITAGRIGISLLYVCCKLRHSEGGSLPARRRRNDCVCSVATGFTPFLFLPCRCSDVGGEAASSVNIDTGRSRRASRDGMLRDCAIRNSATMMDPIAMTAAMRSPHRFNVVLTSDMREMSGVDNLRLLSFISVSAALYLPMFPSVGCQEYVVMYVYIYPHGCHVHARQCPCIVLNGT